MLDERLSLAAALYEPCRLGADLGTDHGLLPCHLLQTDVCKRMILSDISEHALSRAKANVYRRHLEERVSFCCADGLSAVSEPCGCISVTGMGGETLSSILLSGQERLQGAVLVLSSHTSLPLVRNAIQRIRYRIAREELCRAAGRYYLVWRCEPGDMTWDEDELCCGKLLWETGNPLLAGYAQHRIRVMEEKLRGLRSAEVFREEEARLAARELAVCREHEKELSHDHRP